MWPNLSPYTHLMRTVNTANTANAMFNVNAANAANLRRAGPRHGVRVVPKGSNTAAIAEFDTLAQAEAYIQRVLKDHPDWKVELVLIHD